MFGATTVIAAALVLVPGAPLVSILVGTQVLNAVLLLPLLVLMYLMARDPTLMGAFRASRGASALYLVGIALVSSCVAALVVLTIT